MKKDCRKKPRGESGHAAKSELAFVCQEEESGKTYNKDSFWDDFQMVEADKGDTDMENYLTFGEGEEIVVMGDDEDENEERCNIVLEGVEVEDIDIESDDEESWSIPELALKAQILQIPVLSNTSELID